jgi:predicted PurR-regulated permease PerM
MSPLARQFSPAGSLLVDPGPAAWLNVRHLGHAGAVVPERLVRFRARTILAILGIVLAVALALQVIWLARQVISWILIALFLALALNPAVNFLQERGVRRRAVAAGLAYLATLLAITAIGAVFVPTLVDEANAFARELPNYVRDVTEGRGRLGELEREYDIVERVRAAVEDGGAARLLGLSGTAVAITKGVLTAIVALVTIAFLTFFMLIEGPGWMQRFYALLPDSSRPRVERIATDVYRTIGGYVTGNLLISLIAGVTSTIVLLIMGVPFAVALGLLVAILDLVPLAGATLAAIIVSGVAFLESLPAGIVVAAFFIVYQQVENHLLQPLVYSRTVQLSPLAILIAVLIGAKLAGVLGALAAIPVAGTIQVLLLAWLDVRRERGAERPAPL